MDEILIANALKARYLTTKQQVRQGREVVNELLARFPAPDCFEQEDAVRKAQFWLRETDPNQLNLNIT